MDGLTVSVDITNTGAFAGKEIVQVYVHDPKSDLVRPLKELKGFAKVELAPGETKTVSLALDSRAFAYYHPEHKQWITEDGEFEILVAASATDIRQRLTATLQSTLHLPCLLDQESTIREWLTDRRGKNVFEPMYGQVIAKSRKAFSGSDQDEVALGMDVMDMFMDMPLASVLMFQQGEWTKPVDDIVSELLAQVHSMN